MDRTAWSGTQAESDGTDQNNCIGMINVTRAIVASLLVSLKLLTVLAVEVSCSSLERPTVMDRSWIFNEV